MDAVPEATLVRTMDVSHFLEQQILKLVASTRLVVQLRWEAVAARISMLVEQMAYATRQAFPACH